MRRIGMVVALVVGVGACDEADGGLPAAAEVVTGDATAATTSGTDVTDGTEATAGSAGSTLDRIDTGPSGDAPDGSDASVTATTSDMSETGPDEIGPDETGPDTTGPDETGPDPFDYNMFSQEISIGYDMSGAEPRHCAIALAGSSVSTFLQALTGGTTVESESAYCGDDGISCPNLFLHDVLGRDGALAEVLGPLALELGDLTPTEVTRHVVHAKSDVYAVVLAGKWQGQLVGIAFVPDFPYCGVE